MKDLILMADAWPPIFMRNRRLAGMEPAPSAIEIIVVGSPAYDNETPDPNLPISALLGSAMTLMPVAPLLLDQRLCDRAIGLFW